MIGIRTAYFVAPAVTFTSSAALLTVGLKSPIAVNQVQSFCARIPITVGASGGVRAQITLPAGATLDNAQLVLNNTVAPSTTLNIPAAGVPFTNALANAGTHWLDISGQVTNGATAGFIDIEMAQNTSDANTLTVLKGGSMQVIIHT